MVPMRDAGIVEASHEPGGTFNIEHPTSNIQRRTSNGGANPRSLQRSVFDVGRSMFSLGSGVSTREFSFRRNLSMNRLPVAASRQSAASCCSHELRRSAETPLRQGSWPQCVRLQNHVEVTRTFLQGTDKPGNSTRSHDLTPITATFPPSHRR